MKKWIIAAAALVLLFFAGSYFLIPGKIDITRSVTAGVNPTALFRFLSDDSNWRKWWPGSVYNARGKHVLESGGYRFKKNKALYQAFEMLIVKDDHSDNSLLTIFSIGADSAVIKWVTTIKTGNNPFSRIRNYLKAGEAGRQMQDILAAMKIYASNVQHMYGINIRKDKVKVEFLVSTKKRFNSYPSTEDIYESIGLIKKYIAQSKAKAEDYPMMHVSLPDSVHFEMQVAIPVDKYLPGTGILASKKMLKGGDILVTEITGGKTIADSVMKRMDQYVSDHKYIRIAIPFHSLVTDRLNEPDSNKWVTRIYVPIL